jgi:sigma-B regulation protein RsbU (phosphoserine phosphatase)
VIRTRELDPTGPIISALGGSWEVASAPVDPDDLLVALTDGVLEARSADGHEFGVEGVLAVIGALPDWSAGTAVAEVDAAVRTFSAGARHDDMTAVAAILST